MSSTVISIRAAEPELVQLRDFVNFLFDFNLTYEISRLVVDPRYEGFRFSRYIFFRDQRPLLDEDLLRLDEITKESPLKFTTVLAAVPAAVASLWGIVQIAQTVDHWPLERRKLEAEVTKAELEVRKLEREEGRQSPPPLVEGPRDFDRWPRQREAGRQFDLTMQRLQRSPVRLEDVRIRVISENEKKR